MFRTVYDATGGFRRGVLARRGTWLVLGVALTLPVVLDPKIGWYLLTLPPGRPPTHSATAVGMRVLALWVGWLRVEGWAVTSLGAVSYSVYLFHEVVRIAICHVLRRSPGGHGWDLPFWLCCLVGAVLTTAISAAVYRWVERPAIAQGKRWTGSDLAPGRISERLNRRVAWS